MGKETEETAHVSRIRGAVEGNLCAGTLAVRYCENFPFQDLLILMPNQNWNFCILQNTKGRCDGEVGA